MEDKLVTLAIHTFEKAQILKTLLETEGIETSITNVNQIQPVVSAGVRVRIKESDLPHALRIIEDSKLEEAGDVEQIGAGEEAKAKTILCPIDFSGYSLKGIEIGFNLAHSLNASVTIMHAYNNSYFPAIASASPMDVPDSEYDKNVLEHIRIDMNHIRSVINTKVNNKELPDIQFDYVLREGIPEEEIISYAKECKPIMIVMGTRGKSQKEIDLIGSVTGEVIETSKIPVLAIPENIPFEDISKAHDIAFATSFNQNDLLVFDEFVSLIKNYQFRIHLFNISTSRNEWNEIRLSGVKEYFKKQYPDLDISYTVLDDGDLMLAVEKFVRDEKIDVIAISTFRRNIFSRLFYPSIARRMLFHTDTPLLVMHAK